MREIKKILIIRLGAIGDVVYTTALIDAIKSTNSSIEIHYLTSQMCAPVIKHHKNINKLFVLEKKSYTYLYELGQSLKNENYDLYINLQPSLRNKFLGFMLQSKITLNYRKSFKIHAAENFCLTAKKVFKNLEIPKELHLNLSEDSYKNLPEINRNKKIIVFNIGGSSSRQGRLWVPEYWGGLAKLLSKEYDCQIFVTGAKEDLPMSIYIESENVSNLCGELKLDETSALLSKCDLVISNDTGPLHIAAALGVPCLGIFGSTIPHRARPYGNKHCHIIETELKCAACNKRKCKIDKTTLFSPCMQDITAKKVFDFIKSKNLTNLSIQDHA